jgi:hypothetical protein
MTKRSETIIPEIIKLIVSKCDDLIEQAMEREYERFVNLNKSYDEWFSKFDPKHIFKHSPTISFLQSISGKYRVGGTVEYYAIVYSHPNKGDFNLESFEKWFDRYKVDYRDNQTWKLTQSLLKHLFTEDRLDSQVRISKTPKGFCVEFLYSKGPYTFNYKTDAIHAGGHNIQCFHYRYITKIKKVTN